MATNADPGPPGTSALIKRHSLATRLWHWITAVCLLVLLTSGLQIFNAHPSLYWGSDSDFDSPFLSIGARRDANGDPMGYVSIEGLQIPTTGVLGWSSVNGHMQARAFPAWATLPGPQWLSLGRHWHFTAAWVFGVLLVFYLLYSIVSRRRRRLIGVHRGEMGRFGHEVVKHATLRFSRARSYNIIQKLTYLTVLFVLLPLMVLTGLTMSPTMDAAWPWLTEVFGGRQSARTLHFLCAFALVAFFLVHLLLVLISGVLNNMRAMITGGYQTDGQTDGWADDRADAAPAGTHGANAEERHHGQR
ncbi:cytochrome b/b6 domain-containing protein [Salinisphaera sp.]|uniref:cytochrome b/b6 domain-containing protein n=1 Tax=Salinisphaera sp. TaxID=1914330 RepID=UPI002D790A13|nr:cytochrome b/b6 domain-containing protein [Salinisphaera sp.]HET7314166.1 cytochrome b/b6 domain-containing protein [Salinisphaera sp.]